MKNSSNKQQSHKKITNSEEFAKAFRKEAKRLGILDKLKTTPSQSTDEYTVVMRPFAGRKDQLKK